MISTRSSDIFFQLFSHSLPSNHFIYIYIYIYIYIQCRSKGNISGGARDRRRREPLGGSGGMFPQKILESKGLEMLFPAFSKSYL